MSRKRNDFGSKSGGSSGIKSDESFSYLLDDEEAIDIQKKSLFFFFN